MTSETKPEEERPLESGDVQCRCCGAFKSLTPPNSVCYRSINDDAPIEHEWPSSPFASEQFDNATNIAAVKRGSDRDNWLDDAALHRDKAIALRELLALRQRLAEAERLVKQVQPVGLPGPIVGVRIGTPGRRDAVEKRAQERQFFVDRDKFLKGSHD